MKETLSMISKKAKVLTTLLMGRNILGSLNRIWFTEKVSIIRKTEKLLLEHGSIINIAKSSNLKNDSAHFI